MTDSVSRTGKIDAVFFRDRANKTMVVGILKARLQRIMVYVCHGALRADALDAHALKFEIRHRARRVLRERLVDFQGDFLSGLHFARNEMFCDDFLCDCLSHILPLYL